MVKFNTTLIPAGSVVSSARLRLYVQAAAITNLSSAPINVHLLTQDWDQNAANWTRRTATLNWSTAGGAYDAAVKASAQFSALTNGTWVTFDLPAGAVQAWVNSPAANYGVLLKRSTDGDPGYGFLHNKATFASCEHTNASLRPKLEITCTPAGNVLPMVQVTAPVAGGAAPPADTLVMQAGASDLDGSVTKVDFYAGTALLASATSPPFGFRWQHVSCATNVSLVARAVDNAGGVMDSTPVPIRIQSTIYSANMNANPGWALGVGWQYGKPSGYYRLDWSSDEGDPSSGFTGSNVVGYLFSSMLPALTTAVAAVTPAINCSGYSNVTLKFYYWLGIGEAYNSFRAGIDISTNGTTWQNLWTNPNERMSAGVWRPMVLNIAPIADGKPNVYIRWTMGPGNAYYFCGWNLDDVEVLGSPPPRSLADTDGDNVPDMWESRYFGASNVSATADSDNDGLSNYEEYLAGTCPTNDGDVLQLRPTPSNSDAFFFDAIEAGTNYYVRPRYYTLEGRTNLIVGLWSGISGFTRLLGEGQRVTFTNALPGIFFYRLRTQLE